MSSCECSSLESEDCSEVGRRLREAGPGSRHLEKQGKIKHITEVLACEQGGITCGAIDEPTKSSKAIDERVIINFRDKNVVIARFRDKNGGFIDSHSDQSIAIFFYR